MISMMTVTKTTMVPIIVRVDDNGDDGDKTDAGDDLRCGDSTSDDAVDEVGDHDTISNDVEDADTQRSDVLTFRLFRFDPGDPVAFNRRDFVVAARENQCHDGWIGIQVRTVRA